MTKDRKKSRSNYPRHPADRPWPVSHLVGDEEKPRPPTQNGHYREVSVAMPDGGYKRFKVLLSPPKKETGSSRRIVLPNPPPGGIKGEWKIRSLSEPGRVHIVMLAGNGKWVCSCPSFRYHHGVDNDGFCKHIRQIMEKQG